MGELIMGNPSFGGTKFGDWTSGAYQFGEYTFGATTTWGEWDATSTEDPDVCLGGNPHVTDVVNTVTEGAITNGAVTEGDITPATPRLATSSTTMSNKSGPMPRCEGDPPALRSQGRNAVGHAGVASTSPTTGTRAPWRVRPSVRARAREINAMT
jgi:hypothetical protein